MFGAILYSMQLITVESVKSQVGIFQQALQIQVHKLSTRISKMEKDVVTGQVVKQEPAVTTTEAVVEPVSSSTEKVKVKK
jgi:hypothetical protein